MASYIWSRVLTLIPVLLLISIFVFSIMHLLPGDPAMLIMAGEYASTPEQVEALREQLGLNDPLHVQYGRFLAGAVQGDLGRSVHYKRPVMDVIMERLPSTAQLTLVSLVIAVIVGIALGIIAALHHNTWIDNASMIFSFIGITMPLFYIGLVLILVFTVKLGWLPVTGGSVWKRLVLPSLTLGFVSSGLIARLVRANLLEVLRQDYITTARSKGLRERMILSRHAMKNMLIPVVTIVGLQVGHMLSGSVITESVFARPGVGRLAVEAILWKDFPLAQGTILFTATVFVLVNLLV
ncbi:MAG: ABC transporter permease, partial [Chloroflexi bacterium]|nr:ABC transporter permease [Chloroflexota bacterium]